jgi:predicted metal-dependent phosphoesterase TrpH
MKRREPRPFAGLRHKGMPLFDPPLSPAAPGSIESRPAPVLAASSSVDLERAVRALTTLLDVDGAVDLHCHSRCSDGDWEPAALVEDAQRLGLQLLSLTDHDTIAGQAPARGAAERLGVLWLPGMEVSLMVETRLYHVLCYDYDPASPTWATFAEQRRARLERYYLDLFAQLAYRGYPVAPDLARNNDGQIVHGGLAHAVHHSGYAPSVEAAHQLIRSLGLHHPVEITYQPVEEFGQLLRPGEAVFSVAHPARQEPGVSVRLSEEDLRYLSQHLPLVALEAHHPYHSAADVAAYTELAHKYGLAVTCGSDAHGARHRRPLRLHPASQGRAFLELIRDRWASRIPALAGG